MELHIVIGPKNSSMKDKSFDHSENQRYKESRSFDHSESRQWKEQTNKSQDGDVSYNRQGSQQRRSFSKLNKARNKGSEANVAEDVVEANRADWDGVWSDDHTESDCDPVVSDNTDTDDTLLYLDRDGDESERREQSNTENRTDVVTNVKMSEALTSEAMAVK